jgi:transposase
VNRTYSDMAMHYGTAIIPARPYKPRDKAKVEVGVQVVQRWILARLRNRRFCLEIYLVTSGWSSGTANARAAVLADEPGQARAAGLGGRNGHCVKAACRSARLSAGTWGSNHLHTGAT